MSDNLKWLLLIPVVIIMVTLGYVIPKTFGSGEDEPPKNQTNQALEVEIADAEQRLISYQDIVDTDPTNVDAVKGLADRYLELGSLQASNEQLNESFASYKNAVDYYRKYLVSNPAGDARIDLGLTYMYMEMSSIAERELITATQYLPNDQRAWHTLAFVQLQGLGKEPEAIANWEKAYSINPNSSIGKESKSFMDQLATPVGGGTEVTVPPAP